MEKLIETTDAIVVVLDSAGKIQFVNRAFEEITGYTSKELEEASWFETLVPKDRYSEVWEEFQRLSAVGVSDRFENPILTKAGEERYIVWRNNVLHRQDEVIGTASIGIDITERKQAEEALANSEQKLLAVFTSVPVAIAVADLSNGRICDVNHEYERMFECSYDEVVGKTSLELGLWTDPKDRQHLIDLIEKNGKVEDLELALRTRGGRELTARTSALPVTVGGRRYLVYTLADVTERKRVEEQVEVLKRWIDAHHDGAYWIDASNRLIYVNDPGCRVIGYELDELLEQPMSLINPGATPARMKEIWESLRRDGSLSFESMHRRKDGSEFPVELMFTLVRSGGKEYFCGFAHDISERKRAQEERALLTKELQQAQKMEAVGRLAGGVAHNFNNILTALVGYCEILLTKLPKDSDCRPEAEQIKRSANHAATVTRELLLFSRREPGQLTKRDLNAIIAETRALLRQLIRSDIEIVTALSPILPQVKVDRNQIEQVLVNLVLNAQDAMPRGGKITIETEDVELDEKSAEGGGSPPAGRYVTMTVADTGIGMDEDTRAHLFEPFFTTKGPDGGTGLGLATVYGIIEESSGRILVESEPNKGTKFTIYLPALSARR
jgi:PAS domain S-box-containing protein